jgi:predicted DCC family thiol-disulfide oxidoreductase YuxK
VTVVFDGGCPMCRRTVRRLHAIDWLRRLTFADGSNAQVRERVAPGLTEPETLLEMIVVDRGRRYGGYDAMLRLARVVPLLWPFLVVGSLPGISAIGRSVYRQVAARRVRRGRCTDEFCVTE